MDEQHEQFDIARFTQTRLARASQLRDWYERQGAGSSLPEMNVGGPA